MQEDEHDLESYWKDLQSSPPKESLETITKGSLWMGLVHNGAEISASWYERFPAKIEIGDRKTRFQATFAKHGASPCRINRIGLWTTKTQGHILYWSDIDERVFDEKTSIDVVLEINGTKSERLRFQELLERLGFL